MLYCDKCFALADASSDFFRRPQELFCAVQKHNKSREREMI